jgi:hypothetical protein
MFLPEPIDKIQLAGIWRHNEYFDSGLFRRQMKPIVGFVYVAILSIVEYLRRQGIHYSSIKNAGLSYNVHWLS